MNDGDEFVLDIYDLEDISISGWFYRETFTTDDTIVAKRNGVGSTDIGYILYIDDATDKLTFEISDATDEYQIESRSTFTTSGWNHFVIVWDDDSISETRMYINGVEENITRTGTLANVGNADNVVDFRIGGESDTATDSPFAGKLDDIRMYKHTISKEQIKEIISEGAMRFGPATGSP